jgi:hypothetical protein
MAAELPLKSYSIDSTSSPWGPYSAVHTPASGCAPREGRGAGRKLKWCSSGGGAAALPPPPPDSRLRARARRAGATVPAMNWSSSKPKLAGGLLPSGGAYGAAAPPPAATAAAASAAALLPRRGGARCSRTIQLRPAAGPPPSTTEKLSCGLPGPSRNTRFNGGVRLQVRAGATCVTATPSGANAKR